MTTALQDALARYRARMPAPVATACSSRREGDELVCPCGLRWDAHEERPPCPK